MHIPHVDLEGLVFWLSSKPSGSCILSGTSFVGFPELNGDIPFMVENSKKPHSLHNVCLLASVVFFPSGTEEVSLMRW